MIISRIGTAANNTAFIKPSYITNLTYKPYKNAEVLLLEISKEGYIFFNNNEDDTVWQKTFLTGV